LLLLHIIVGDRGRIHCLDTKGTYLRTIILSTGTSTQYISIGHNNQIYYTTTSSINCVNWDGTEVFYYKIPNEKGHRKIAIDRNGNIYVAGYHTHTIQRLHANGTVDCVVAAIPHILVEFGIVISLLSCVNVCRLMNCICEIILPNVTMALCVLGIIAISQGRYITSIAFMYLTVNKIIDHTITHKTLTDQQAQFVSDKTTTMSTFKLQNRIEDTGRVTTGMG
jgi:hypothetical protein